MNSTSMRPPSAPHGAPQIEATLDIDTNDSLNVPAQNKSTDRSKKITIASVNGHPSQTETDHVNKEQMQSYTAEQIVYVPVPQIRKETDEVTQFIPQDEISDHVVEQTVDILSAQIQEQAVEPVRIIPQDHFQQHTAEGTVNVSMIMRMGEPAVQAVMKNVGSSARAFSNRSETIQPVEQNSSCDVEKFKDANVPSVMKEVFEVVNHSTGATFESYSWKSRLCVCHESSRTLNDTDINRTQDVCMSAQKNTGAESVNRCSCMTSVPMKIMMTVDTDRLTKTRKGRGSEMFARKAASWGCKARETAIRKARKSASEIKERRP